MEFIDTPNPNAKKILINHNYENSIYLDEDSNLDKEIKQLVMNPGIKNVFTGPNFLTIMKNDDSDWNEIIKDLKNNS